jgi:hypothetical protein
MTAETAERRDHADKVITFRVPPDLWQRIEAERQRELLSVSAFCRRGVLQSLALAPPDGL